ncbi:MAG: hypothetical protein V4710_05385 [Verrucomicrobiota bacterium]
MKRAPGDHALVAHVALVLEDQFEELGVRQPVGFGFLQAHLQAEKQSGAAELACFDAGVHGHLFHALIEDPHVARVPVHRDLAADLLSASNSQSVIQTLHLSISDGCEIVPTHYMQPEKELQLLLP